MIKADYNANASNFYSFLLIPLSFMELLSPRYFLIIPRKKKKTGGRSNCPPWRIPRPREDNYSVPLSPCPTVLLFYSVYKKPRTPAITGMIMAGSILATGNFLISKMLKPMPMISRPPMEEISRTTLSVMRGSTNPASRVMAP